MKSVIKEYGTAVLAILGGVGIISIMRLFFFGEGCFFAILISAVVQGNMPIGGESFEAYMNHASPRICLEEPYALKEDEVVNLQKVFSAVTEDNKLIPVSLRGCWNLDGTEGAIHVVDENQICANDPGIYWMNICAVDDKGVQREVLLKVFVNER